MQITNQDELEKILQQIDGCRALAIDTEFMREKTYYPLLCLIQMSTDDTEFIIDPLKVKNLKPLAKIFTDPKTVKIFHAGSQDRELIYENIGVIPTPVFDTQTAAPLLGLPQQVGYGAAVSAFCGVKLAKADSLTDWSRRPLTNSQVDYALDDVRYLIPMYDEMNKRLREAGRLSWLDDDFAKMVDPATYKKPDSELWHKVKKASGLPRAQLKHASSLAVWRENIARKRNIPRRWVLSDELIVEICKRQPASVEDLYRIRGTHEKLTSQMAKDIVHLIKLDKNSDPSTWPLNEKKRRTHSGSDAIADVLMGIVRLRARENNVAPQTLALHDELLDLASGYRDNIAVLQGWRYQIVGRELLEFLDGEKTVSFSSGKLHVE